MGKALSFVFIHGITKTVFVHADENARLLKIVLGSIG